MNEPFLIPVTYQGSEQDYKARFERWGYTHRIAVLIGEATFIFEPDEEGSYRVLSSDTTISVDTMLLESISKKLTDLKIG